MSILGEKWICDQWYWSLYTFNILNRVFVYWCVYMYIYCSWQFKVSLLNQYSTKGRWISRKHVTLLKMNNFYQYYIQSISHLTFLFIFFFFDALSSLYLLFSSWNRFEFVRGKEKNISLKRIETRQSFNCLILQETLYTVKYSVVNSFLHDELTDLILKFWYLNRIMCTYQCFQSTGVSYPFSDIQFPLTF